MILRLGEEAFPAPPEVVRAWVEYLTRLAAWEDRFFSWWDRPEMCRSAPAWKYAYYWLVPLRKAERALVEAVTFWGRVYSLAFRCHAVPHYMGEEIGVLPYRSRFLDFLLPDGVPGEIDIPSFRRARFFGEIYEQEKLIESPRIAELLEVYMEMYPDRSRELAESARQRSRSHKDLLLPEGG
jgi:hypothetical protein